MPPAPDAFRHLPALRDLLIPTADSAMRLTDQRFAELDAQAAIEGWALDWRMDHEAREANRYEVLSGRLGRDLWVFAYGSLIWDPAVEVVEFRPGTLVGWSRSFCMRIEGGRATQDQPGLMAALDEGGCCDGVVIRIPADLVDQETNYMWRREMFSGAYRPIFREIATPQGDVEALVFAIEHSNRRYVSDIPKDEAARLIAVAEGDLGPNFDYLDLLVRNLGKLGIEDSDMSQLRSLAADHRDAMARKA
ncbi:MAG: gamma-glutamylcyclotransferase [Pseudomonadota bacterium]